MKSTPRRRFGLLTGLTGVVLLRIGHVERVEGVRVVEGLRVGVHFLGFGTFRDESIDVSGREEIVQHVLCARSGRLSRLE